MRGCGVFAAVFTLILVAPTARSAFVSVESEFDKRTGAGTASVFIVLESGDPQAIAAVDVGIDPGSDATFLEVSSHSNDDPNCDSAFCGAFLGPSNVIKENGVAFLTGSSLGGGVTDGDGDGRILIGTIDYQIAPGCPVVFAVIDPDTLYKISSASSEDITSSSPGRGEVVGTLFIIPEPGAGVLLTLIALALAFRSLRA